MLTVLHLPDDQQVIFRVYPVAMDVAADGSKRSVLSTHFALEVVDGRVGVCQEKLGLVVSTYGVIDHGRLARAGGPIDQGDFESLNRRSSASLFTGSSISSGRKVEPTCHRLTVAGDAFNRVCLQHRDDRGCLVLITLDEDILVLHELSVAVSVVEIVVEHRDQRTQIAEHFQVFNRRIKRAVLFDID